MVRAGARFFDALHQPERAVHCTAMEIYAVQYYVFIIWVPDIAGVLSIIQGDLEDGQIRGPGATVWRPGNRRKLAVEHRGSDGICIFTAMPCRWMHTRFFNHAFLSAFV